MTRGLSTPKRVNFKKFCAFIEAVLGLEYVAKLQGDLDTHGGNRNPNGVNQHGGQPDIHKVDQDEPGYGTGQAYLRKRIKKTAPEVLANIGNGKQYKTVHKAAVALGIIKVTPRFSIPIDPEAAALSKTIRPKDLAPK